MSPEHTSGALRATAALVRRGSFAVGLDLHVPPGTIVALTGPNGTGKSTILEAIAGLVPLAEGALRLGGQMLATGDPTHDDATAPGMWVPPEQRGTGFVPQRHVLFGHLSAVENVAFGLRARGVRRSVALAQAAQWLDQVNLADHAGVRANRLSGGQSQRVALARALCAGPSMLLLDEPFSALDTASRSAARALLAQVVVELEVPTVLVSHDQAEVRDLADDLVDLRDHTRSPG